MIRGHQICELGIGRETLEEVGANRDEHRSPAIGIPRRFDELADKAPPLVVGDLVAEDLLELVDRDDEALTHWHLAEDLCQRRAEGGGQCCDWIVAGADDGLPPRGGERRQQPGPQKRRLPAARRTDDRQERRFGELP